MRVNVYAEEMTNKNADVSIQHKSTKDGEFIGVRFELEGEFNAVTFWGTIDDLSNTILPALKTAVREVHEFLNNEAEE
jgi:hypothetical protein